MDGASVFVLFLLVLGGLGASAFLLYAAGGPGVLLARATRPSRHARHAHPLQAPASPWSSLATSPGRGAGAGFSRAEELAAIDRFYANDLNALTENIDGLIPNLVPEVSLRRVAFEIAEKTSQLRRRMGDRDGFSSFVGDVQREHLEQRSFDALRFAEFRRSLVDMPDEERATLRQADMLELLGAISREERLRIRIPLIWNDGKCMVSSPAPFAAADRLVALREALSAIVRGHFGDGKQGKEYLQGALRAALQPDSFLSEADRQVLQRYLVGGARWMTPGTASTALMKNPGPSPAALKLGWVRGTQTDLVFDLPQSLITIGPPGQGKSQLLMRNLLMMKAGAVVIDIKGELYRETHAWREREVGPTYRFVPGTPEDSIHFNPLDAVRFTPADAYDDVKKLVDLMMVLPDGQKADYWDKRGLALLADAMFEVAYVERDDRRTIDGVFHRLSFEATVPGSNRDPDAQGYLEEGSELWKWTRHLEATGISRLVRAGKNLRNLPAKARDSVFETARTHGDTWQSPRMEELTQDSTFNPAWLREQNATLYICVTNEELAQYASVVRALLGMTFYALTREAPEDNALPVTFFLDEMPQLKNMDVLQRALDTGRGHGVRLWMFAQNFGQLQELYKNPSGFVKSSMVRQYMGIEGADALKFTNELGQREGLLDGRRKPLVEPHQLYGEEFRDLILTCIQGYDPVMLEKTAAWSDEATKTRMASYQG